ncbi:MAG TPA: hypothetical protein QGF02_04805 [Candidatus Babeliales bacterium]|nr:hypothetical protein [Candidatus Babeliales bacterium]
MVSGRSYFFIASFLLSCIVCTIVPRNWLVPAAQTRQYLLFPSCSCVTEVVYEKVKGKKKDYKKPKRRYFSDLDNNDEDYDYHDEPKKSFEPNGEYQQAVVKTVLKDEKFCLDIWVKAIGILANKPTDCGTLSHLLFAKSSFQLKDAFEDGEASIAYNPFVNLATITPDPEFSESGFEIGENFALKLTNCCHIGVRARLPFKTKQVKPKSSFSDFVKGGTLAELRRIQREPVGTQVIEDSFAYRLDLLSLLFQNGVSGAKFIRYDLVNLTMDQKDVTDNNGNPIHLVGRTSGTFPPSPFSATVATVAAAPFVDGAGSNVSNNQRARFEQGVSYSALGNDSTQQSELFVVPTLNAGGTAVNTDASSIMTDAENILVQTGLSSLQSFLDEKNISFASQRQNGLGDLDIEFFINCDLSSCFWFEGRFNAVFPTGVKDDDPGKLFLQPLGNNGHVEIGLGGALGWDMCRSIKLYGDCSYNKVLSATECVAGSFSGATVKNIGPATRAKISWDYFLAHASVILMYPSSDRFGLNLRYQYYNKKKDSICFCSKTIKDLAGETKTLDSTILKEFTDVRAHQLGADIFSIFEFCTFWGGMSYVVGGTNAPKEFIWNVGFDINF